MKSNKIFTGFKIILGLMLIMVGLFSFMHTGGIDVVSGGSTFAGIAMTAVTWEPEDSGNLGGFTCEAYLGFSGDIANYPTLDAAPTTYEGLVRLIGSYTMKEAKKFIEVYVTADTFKADAANQGEIDAQSFKTTGEFFYPGTKAECLGFCKAINNKRGVLIGVDPNDGNRYNFGTKGLPVRFKPKVAWGAKTGDRRGATITWEADNPAPALIYSGVIPLSDSDIPAIS